MLKRQWKTVKQAVIPGNFKRRYRKSSCVSGLFFYWLTVLTCIPSSGQETPELEVVYRRFFQFWLVFPQRNYQLRSKEYNFNWCWHHTLDLKKTFPVFENLSKHQQHQQRSSVAWKYSLTGMRDGRFESCERHSSLPDLVNSLPTPGLLLKTHWRNSSTVSAEEFYYCFYYSEGLKK